MTVISTAKLTHSALQRFAHQRHDRSLAFEKDARIILYSDLGFICLNNDEASALLYLEMQNLLNTLGNPEPAFEHLIFMGRDTKSAVFTLNIDGLNSHDNEAVTSVLKQACAQKTLYKTIKEFLIQSSPLEIEILSAAQALFSWHKSRQFCGVCGMRNTPRDWGWKLACTACEQVEFPRTDLAVIMTVEHNDNILLGRPHTFPPELYSCLSGFVEPGESIETAVRREVQEESGVLVGDVSYQACQPWPFPMSLMLACTSQALDPRLNIDHDEMDDVRWFSRDDVQKIFQGHIKNMRPPFKGSVARFLLENWLQDTQ